MPKPHTSFESPAQNRKKKQLYCDNWTDKKLEFKSISPASSGSAEAARLMTERKVVLLSSETCNKICFSRYKILLRVKPAGLNKE